VHDKPSSGSPARRPGSPLLAGLDVGGTKLGLCIGDADGRVLARDRIATDPTRPAAELLAASLARLRELATGLSAGPIAALGLAVPGPLSYAEGRLLEVPNLPLWQFFPLRDWLQRESPWPASFMNDANASMLAEALWGAARGTQSAVFLTMSTGMGAGLWLDGRVYEGPRALAGEIGHLRLRDDGPVGFGVRGSVEGYCSGPGIVQVAEAELLAARQAGLATRLLGLDPITPKDVCELARAGDTAALAVIQRCGRELGRLCAILADVLDPELIVLGTIGTAYFELFAPLVRAGLEADAIRGAVTRVRVAPSLLEDRGNQTALAVARRLLDAPPSPTWNPAGTP
jgi:glucokinase